MRKVEKLPQPNSREVSSSKPALRFLNPQTLVDILAYVQTLPTE